MPLLNEVGMQQRQAQLAAAKAFGMQHTSTAAGAPDAPLLHHAHHLVLHVAQLRASGGGSGHAWLSPDAFSFLHAHYPHTLPSLRSHQ